NFSVMERVILLIAFLITFHAYSQSKETNALSADDYELINATLIHFQQRIPNLNKNFLNKPITNSLKGRVAHHQMIHRKHDSVCRNSKDTLLLKISCRRAYNTKILKDLFTDSDFDYFQHKNSHEQRSVILDTSKLTRSTFNALVDGPSLDELKRYQYQLNSTFSTTVITFENIYYTEDQRIAVVTYMLVDFHSNVIHSIFEKKQGLWWEHLITLGYP
ncbi:MAG: hypothetical protein R3359_12610, partial [Marinirhabdus sp.]|nr:hypothetical protein [Marinirhabdus sp.]